MFYILCLFATPVVLVQAPSIPSLFVGTLFFSIIINGALGHKASSFYDPDFLLLRDATLKCQTPRERAFDKILAQVCASIGLPRATLLWDQGFSTFACPSFNGSSVVIMGRELLAMLSPGAALAVLSHEIGHLKHAHSSQALARKILLDACGCFACFCLAILFGCAWGSLGIDPDWAWLSTFPAFGLFALLGVAAFRHQSRRFEFEADAFAVSIHGAPALREALRALQAHELAHAKTQRQRRLSQPPRKRTLFMRFIALPYRVAGKLMAGRLGEAFASHPSMALRLARLDAPPRGKPVC